MVGVSLDNVRVITGDTAVTPYGGGTWASRGAGIGGEAVLQAAKALFGKPLDNAPLRLGQADVDRIMDTNATLNTRETPIPLQLPDWNAWLKARGVTIDVPRE